MVNFSGCIESPFLRFSLLRTVISRGSFLSSTKFSSCCYFILQFFHLLFIFVFSSSGLIIFVSLFLPLLYHPFPRPPPIPPFACLPTYISSSLIRIANLGFPLPCNSRAKNKGLPGEDPQPSVENNGLQRADKADKPALHSGRRPAESRFPDGDALHLKKRVAEMKIVTYYVSYPTLWTFI